MSADNRALALRLRPQTLDGLIGQDHIVSSIRKEMSSNREPSAWMFIGPSGCGKTTLARILALSLQCKHQKVFGRPCSACQQHRDDFAITEINASECNGVEDIGRIAANARYAPTPPSRRSVFILDEAQMMSHQAQNLLLKHFEDPVSTTVWIICTTEPQRIRPTLRRRCTLTYTVRPLKYEDRERLLSLASKKAGLTRPLAELVEASEDMDVGSPGLLLNALEAYETGLDARTAISHGSAVTENGYYVCQAVTSGNWEELAALLENATPEDARWLRASVSGWLRGMLRKERSPKRCRFLSDQILKVLAPAPFEDGLLLHWLWGTFFHICSSFKVDDR